MENQAKASKALITEEPAPVDTSDSPSLEGLFQTHHKAVFRAAYRVSGSTHDAEDVLQTVFLRLLKRGEQPQFASNPVGYLCKAAINASLDQLRSKKRHPVSGSVANDWEPIDGSSIANTSSSSTNAEFAVHARDQKRHLRWALAELNPRSAEMFALRYFEEISNEQIADILNTSASVVAVTLHRTRSRLQELLSEFMLADEAGE